MLGANSFIVIWSGATANIWSNEQCPSLGRGADDNLDQCKKSCLEKTGCTAINYKSCSFCGLHECTDFVPGPALQQNGHNGYYVTNYGTIKYYR